MLLPAYLGTDCIAEAISDSKRTTDTLARNSLNEHLDLSPWKSEAAVQTPVALAADGTPSIGA
jgi:hypothetical protein